MISEIDGHHYGYKIYHGGDGIVIAGGRSVFTDLSARSLVGKYVLGDTPCLSLEDAVILCRFICKRIHEDILDRLSHGSSVAMFFES